MWGTFSYELFLQLSYLGILFWNQTNQSMCCKGRVEKSHVKLWALRFLPWSGKSNRMINHMQPSPTAKLTSLKIQTMWERPWRLQMPSLQTLVHINVQCQFHQINQITGWQPLESRVGLFWILTLHWNSNKFKLIFMILAPPLASSILIFKDNLNARRKSQIWGEAFGPICNLNTCHCVTGRLVSKHLISDPDLLSAKLKVRSGDCFSKVSVTFRAGKLSLCSLCLHSISQFH